MPLSDGRPACTVVVSEIYAHASHCKNTSRLNTGTGIKMGTWNMCSVH